MAALDKATLFFGLGAILVFVMHESEPSTLTKIGGVMTWLWLIATACFHALQWRK